MSQRTNRWVQTSEEAQVYVRDLDLFVVISLGKLFEENVYVYEWTSGKQSRLIKQGKKFLSKTENLYLFLSRDFRVHPLHRHRRTREYGRRRSSFSSLDFVIVARGHCVMTETTWVSFRTLSNCFPLMAFSHFPLHADFSIFLTLGYCIVPNSEVSSCHFLINMTSYYCVQSGTAWCIVIFLARFPLIPRLSSSRRVARLRLVFCLSRVFSLQGWDW